MPPRAALHTRRATSRPAALSGGSPWRASIPETPRRSPVLAASIVHEALFRLAQASSGDMQVPIWSRLDEHGERIAPVAGSPRSGSLDVCSPRDAATGTSPRVRFFTREPLHQACPRLRIDGPLTSLASRGAIDYATATRPGRRYVLLDPRAREAADVVVHQRFFPTRLFANAVMPVIESSHAAVIYDLDDHLLDLPADHARAADARSELDAIRSAIEGADLVTTPSATLAGYLDAAGAGSVRVILNAFDPRDWPDPLPPTAVPHERSLRVGIVGGPSHAPDVEAILDEVVSVLADDPGSGGAARLGVRSGSRPPDTRRGRARGLLTDYRDYTRELCALGLDLALVPLVTTRSTGPRATSSASSTPRPGVPALFSESPAYASVRADVDGLLVPERSGAWSHAIRRALSDPDLRTGLARRARERNAARGHDRALGRRLALRHRGSAQPGRGASRPRSRPDREPIRIPEHELLVSDPGGLASRPGGER